ncbi:hypothetical protein SynA1840_00874 [Synechococcus sp. A18-40]|nr:hypothetical protein SynA1840_00874 [Synechococcus sp. A18-40]
MSKNLVQKGGLPLVDWPQVDAYLKLTEAPGERLLVLFPPKKGGGGGMHFPITDGVIPKDEVETALRNNRHHSLGIVVNPALPKPADWGTKPEHFTKTARLKVWGASNDHISCSRVIFIEGDGGLSDQEQMQVVHDALPVTPTFVLKTGGQSLHFYFRVDEELTPAKFTELQKRLNLACSKVSEAYGADDSISSPCQVMRLPGGVHGGAYKEHGKREHARMVLVSARVYGLQLLEKFLPPLEDSRPRSSPRKGFFSEDSKWFRDGGWFSRRPHEEQRRLAVEMAQCLPKREKTGQGDYAICISALYALVGHFGAEEAGAICLEAAWESENWDPIERITTINSTPTNTIGTFIEKARQGGWRLQEEQLEAAPEPMPVERPITLEEMFPASVAADLRRITRYMPWPDTLIITSFLTTVSAAVRLGCTIELIAETDFEVPLNLYHCVVGDSGTRKTLAERALIKKPLAPLKRELRLQYKEKLLAYKAQLASAEDGDPPTPPMNPCLDISDATQEAMEEQLMAQEQWRLPLLVLKDELAGWFAALDQYKPGGKSKAGSAQAKQILEFFDGRGFFSKRVGESRYCDDTKVSISGAIQPEVLRGMQDDKDADGQWARFLFSPLPAKVVRLPHTREAEELKAIAIAEEALSVIPLRVHRMPPVFLTLDAEALEVFCDYDYRVSEAAQKAMLPSHAALLNKSPGKVGRVAGLLWVLDYVTEKTGDDEVGVEFVQRAIRLVEHLDRYAMQFNVEANQTAKEKCMWRLHRNAGKTKAWIPQRKLRDNCSPSEKERFDAAEMQEMLQELANTGYGEVRSGPRGGMDYRFLLPKEGTREV